MPMHTETVETYGKPAFDRTGSVSAGMFVQPVRKNE